MGATPRRTTRTLLAAVVLTTVAVLATPTAAHAEGGLAVSGTARYVVDPKAELVRATVTINLRNVSANRDTGGGTYVYYFFDAYSVPVPAGARDVEARSAGTDLPVSLSRTEEPSTRLAEVRFPNLLFGNSRRVELTYTVPGAPPRSKDSTRVGPGYATFAASGPGDGSAATVEVVAPSSMTFTSTVDGFSESTSGSRTTYRLSGSTLEDGGIWSVVSLRDEDVIAEKQVTAGSTTVWLEAFPDDPKWSAFVGDRVTEGLPVLVDLVGERWPGGLDRIREDASTSLRGYDGWFDPDGNEIVVGEQLDADLIYHELSHAWFDRDAFEQRWLSEGLAQTTAARATAATGEKVRRQLRVSRSAEDAIALNRWQDDVDDRGGSVNDYAYPASYRVMDELLGDLDDAQYAAVVGSAVRGESAYDRPGTTSVSTGRVTWSRWLDLVESRGGVKDADEVLSRWVLTPDQRRRLDGRAAARTAYAEIDTADGAWLPPLGLRVAMTSWRFREAGELREQVAPLGAAARTVQNAASQHDLAVPASVQKAYENADSDEDVTAVTALLPEAARTISAVGDALEVRDASRDPFTTLGAHVLGVDARADRAADVLEEGRLAPARAAAAEVAERAPWLLPLGLGLVALALVLVVGLGLLTGAVLRRRRGHSVVLAGPEPGVAVVADPLTP